FGQLATQRLALAGRVERLLADQQGEVLAERALAVDEAQFVDAHLAAAGDAENAGHALADVLLQSALVVAVAGAEAGGVDQDQVRVAGQRAAIEVQLDEQRRLGGGVRVFQQRPIGGQLALLAAQAAAVYVV